MTSGEASNDEVDISRSFGQQAWDRLRRNRLAMFSMWTLLTLTVLCFLAPVLAPYAYEAQNLDLGASPPSAEHWFGTDQLGRDLFTRVLYGGRVSFGVGFAATFVALFIGVTWGAVAGFTGGRVDSLMMRTVDVLYALPFALFVIILMVVFGRNLLLLFMAIGLVEWLTMARIVRSQVLVLRNREFVRASQAMGASTGWILRRHIVPNVLGVVAIYVTLTIPSIMILEAFLSFLGLGVQPPASSWGLLISQGVKSMEEYIWLLAFPGVVFSLTLFCMNFLGDGLRDALDPKTVDDGGS